MGPSIVVANIPTINATETGATSARIAERPDARVTTSSEERASARNRLTVPRIMISGRIWSSVSGAFKRVSPINCARPTPKSENLRV